MKERKFLSEGEKKNHIKGLHIQDMQLVHYGQDSKAYDRCSEAKREYYMLKLKKCTRLSRLHFRNYMIPTCEWNYKDAC